MIEWEPGLSLGVRADCRRIGPRTDASLQPMGKVYECCRGPSWQLRRTSERERCGDSDWKANLSRDTTVEEIFRLTDKQHAFLQARIQPQPWCPRIMPGRLSEDAVSAASIVTGEMVVRWHVIALTLDPCHTTSSAVESCSLRVIRSVSLNRISSTSSFSSHQAFQVQAGSRAEDH